MAESAKYGRTALKQSLLAGAISICMAAGWAGAQNAEDPKPAPHRQYLGFDRNDYPGDAALPSLRRNFRFTSYWLNAPPGEAASSWTGKREILRRHGFGFLVLFNGRTDAELKTAAQNGQGASTLGDADGRAAADAARREGFPKNVLIFLDQEEGGRLLAEQVAYLFAWADAVSAAGARAGVYCSAIEVPEGNETISTAKDILNREMVRMFVKDTMHQGPPARFLVLWVANDQCPPAPGCTLAAPPLENFASILPQVEGASVWQYAQSPRRKQFSAACPANQAADGNCYAPGVPAEAKIFLDLDVADSPDPSAAPEK